MFISHHNGIFCEKLFVCLSMVHNTVSHDTHYGNECRHFHIVISKKYDFDLLLCKLCSQNFAKFYPFLVLELKLVGPQKTSCMKSVLFYLYETFFFFLPYVAGLKFNGYLKLLYFG